jgi:hypothetical protein
MVDREEDNQYRPIGISEGMNLETFLSGGRQLK